MQNTSSVVLLLRSFKPHRELFQYVPVKNIIACRGKVCHFRESGIISYASLHIVKLFQIIESRIAYADKLNEHIFLRTVPDDGPGRRSAHV